MSELFITPIPRSYPSSTLDGVARNYISCFSSTWACKNHGIYHVWLMVDSAFKLETKLAEKKLS